MQAISCSVKDAVTASGLGRTTLYSLMNDGRLAYTKVGVRRLVHVESLQALVRGTGQDD